MDQRLIIQCSEPEQITPRFQGSTQYCRCQHAQLHRDLTQLCRNFR